MLIVCVKILFKLNQSKHHSKKANLLNLEIKITRIVIITNLYLNALILAI